MGKSDDKPKATNGPYSWGSGPRPQPKSKAGRIIKKLIDIATGSEKR